MGRSRSDAPDADRAPAKRGRPPAYDRGLALGQAGDAFWKSGYSATTLDALGAAMNMNRPSLYAAFGDKHSLYLEAFAQYAGASLDRLAQALGDGRPLAQQLASAYDAALALYLADRAAPRGCFLVGTAVGEAVDDIAIREALHDALKAIDATFEERFRRAAVDGELPAKVDAAALGQVAGALLNALAVRARAGESRESLKTMARTGVRLLCG